jgi:hypothetical protein
MKEPLMLTNPRAENLIVLLILIQINLLKRRAKKAISEASSILRTSLMKKTSPGKSIL